MDQLKVANAAPVHEAKDPLDKTNYRSISILPLLFKVYEKSIFKQQSVHANKFQSQILCGFRKAHNTQQTLFRLLES